MRKYELLYNNSINYRGRTLFRIRALCDILDVNASHLHYIARAGDLGGYVESEKNLSHFGGAWIDRDALVFDEAHVSGNAVVSGKAHVYDKARISGNAKVYGNVRIYDEAHIYGYAWVGEDACVSGKTRIYGYTHLYGKVQAYGKTRLRTGWFSGDKVLYNTRTRRRK